MYVGQLPGIRGSACIFSGLPLSLFLSSLLSLCAPNVLTRDGCQRACTLTSAIGILAIAACGYTAASIQKKTYPFHHFVYHFQEYARALSSMQVCHFSSTYSLLVWASCCKLGFVFVCQCVVYKSCLFQASLFGSSVCLHVLLVVMFTTSSITPQACDDEPHDLGSPCNSHL